MAGAAQEPIDFTMMYATHDAFRRDLERFAAAVAEGRADTPQVRAGWENFKRQLHIHHTVEDDTLWPRVYEQVTGRPADLALLEEMEDEHSRIDPRLDAVDEALGGGPAGMVGLPKLVKELTATLVGHLDHEERSALPLIQDVLTQDDWRAFGLAMRAGQGGMKGAAVYIPWTIDGMSGPDRERFFAALPPPVRVINRLVWEPRYRKRTLWAA